MLGSIDSTAGVGSKKNGIIVSKSSNSRDVGV